MAAALSIAALTLTACGGGGGEGVAPPPGNTPPTTPPTVAPTRNEAARFLTQATFGPSTTDIDRVVALGYAAWLEEQFNSQASTHLPAVPAYGDIITPLIFGPYPLQSTFWTKQRPRPTNCGSGRCIRCRRSS